MIWEAQKVHFSLRLEVRSNAPITDLVEIFYSKPLCIASELNMKVFDPTDLRSASIFSNSETAVSVNRDARFGVWGRVVLLHE